MMPITKDNGPSIPQSQYNIPNMNQWLNISQLPNTNEIYKARHNKRCNNG